MTETTENLLELFEDDTERKQSYKLWDQNSRYHPEKLVLTWPFQIDKSKPSKTITLNKEYKQLHKPYKIISEKIYRDFFKYQFKKCFQFLDHENPLFEAFDMKDGTYGQVGIIKEWHSCDGYSVELEHPVVIRFAPCNYRGAECSQYLFEISQWFDAQVDVKITPKMYYFAELQFRTYKQGVLQSFREMAVMEYVGVSIFDILKSDDVNEKRIESEKEQIFMDAVLHIFMCAIQLWKWDLAHIDLSTNNEMVSYYDNKNVETTFELNGSDYTIVSPIGNAHFVDLDSIVKTDTNADANMQFFRTLESTNNKKPNKDFKYTGNGIVVEITPAWSEKYGGYYKSNRIFKRWKRATDLNDDEYKGIITTILFRPHVGYDEIYPGMPLPIMSLVFYVFFALYKTMDKRKNWTRGVEFLWSLLTLLVSPPYPTPETLFKELITLHDIYRVYAFDDFSMQWTRSIMSKKENVIYKNPEYLEQNRKW